MRPIQQDTTVIGNPLLHIQTPRGGPPHHMWVGVHRNTRVGQEAEDVKENMGKKLYCAFPRQEYVRQVFGCDVFSSKDHVCKAWTPAGGALER